VTGERSLLGLNPSETQAGPKDRRIIRDALKAQGQATAEHVQQTSGSFWRRLLPVSLNANKSDRADAGSADRDRRKIGERLPCGIDEGTVSRLTGNSRFLADKSPKICGSTGSFVVARYLRFDHICVIIKLSEL
jgi:hypothetical protein